MFAREKYSEKLIPDSLVPISSHRSKYKRREVFLDYIHVWVILILQRCFGWTYWAVEKTLSEGSDNEDAEESASKGVGSEAGKEATQTPEMNIRGRDYIISMVFRFNGSFRLFG